MEIRSKKYFSIINNIIVPKNIINSKLSTDLYWNSIQAPRLEQLLTPDDIHELNRIAMSLKLTSKLDKKLKMIDNIMTRRGFKKYGSGTNRVIYRHLEDKSFVIKIALDRTGINDNPLEYKNQFLLKPFVTKMFQISPCGTVGIAERVEPLRRVYEFEAVSDQIFETIVFCFIGKYILEDFGVKSFMNWGVRAGFGPVLLDYPYIFETDYRKLFCNIQLPDGTFCNGKIDYDGGFNGLYCRNCGKRYFARELGTNIKENKIINKGGNLPMKVVITKNGDVLAKSDMKSEFIEPKEEKTEKIGGNDVIVELVKVDRSEIQNTDLAPAKPKIDASNNTISFDLEKFKELLEEIDCLGEKVGNLQNLLVQFKELENRIKNIETELDRVNSIYLKSSTNNRDTDNVTELLDVIENEKDTKAKPKKSPTTSRTKPKVNEF